MRILHSIKTKLITVSILLLVIPLLIMGYFGYENSKSNLDELGASNLKNSVELTIEMIEALNDEVQKGTLSLEDAQEKVMSSVLGEKKEDGTRPINTNIDLGENGYIFIMDQEGTVIASAGSSEGDNFWDAEDTEGVKFIQEVINVGNNGGGLTYYDWPLPDNENQIAPKVTYSKTDPYWDWSISASTYMKDFNAPATEIFYALSFVMVISLIIGIVIIWIFANNFSKPIHVVTKHMNLLANGDLTQEKIVIKSKDETGQLANAMNQMQGKLQEMIYSISKASDTITSRSEELRSEEHTSELGSNQIATTMQELATGAERQANSASESSTSRQEYAQEVLDANKNGEHMFDSSVEVLALTEEGSKLMESAKMQMDKIDHIVQDAVQKVQGLDIKSQEISKLVLVIQDIAH